MRRRRSGTYVVSSTAGEKVEAFVPAPLPPHPALEVDSGLRDLVAAASLELARLNVAARMVPSTQWFIYGFVRKEAVLTSQIEGTQATLTDLLAYEAGSGDKKPPEDVEEVCNYVRALEYARAELASPKGFPLSLRLLKETHARLMRGVRGQHKQPGEFRNTQNWIGGTRPGNAIFVPPPPERLAECLVKLESYLHMKDDLPPLLRAGLVHVQFETIHPFLDGNGRLGRLLVGLLLEEWHLLESPLLYISLYFKQHRQEYYRRLDAVRRSGDWEGWSRFFLRGVAAIAAEATDAAGRLFALFDQDRKRLLGSPNASVAAIRLIDHLPRHPMITIGGAVKILDTTKPTATKAVAQLIEYGVLKETTGRRRGRSFAYAAYLDLLRKGTDL